MDRCTRPHRCVPSRPGACAGSSPGRAERWVHGRRRRRATQSGAEQTRGAGSVRPNDSVEDLHVRDENVAPGRLPNLIIVGVSKGGTTSLFHYLRQHPDICGSDIKELYYFAPLRHGGELGPIEDYAVHFRHCTGYRYAVEATPGYFYGGRPPARGVRDTCPDVHVVVSLRSPADRCWSWFRFQKSRLRIPKDMSFEAYLDRCEELHRAGVDGEIEHRGFWGLGGGCYDTWLDSWVEEFGERYRVVFFEDLVRAPARWSGTSAAGSTSTRPWWTRSSSPWRTRPRS